MVAAHDTRRASWGVVEMTCDEFFQRNSELAIEFSRHLINHPELDKSIPEDATLIFLPEYDAELARFNRGMAEQIRQEGGRVICVKIRGLRSEAASRLEGVAIEQ